MGRLGPPVRLGVFGPSVAAVERSGWVNAVAARARATSSVSAVAPRRTGGLWDPDGAAYAEPPSGAWDR